MNDLELYHSNIRKLSESKEELNILHEEISKLKNQLKSKCDTVRNQSKKQSERVSILKSELAEVKTENLKLKAKLHEK